MKISDWLEFGSLFFPLITYEGTAQNGILSVPLPLFAHFIKSLLHSENQGSLKNDKRWSDLKEQCAKLCLSATVISCGNPFPPTWGGEVCMWGIAGKKPDWIATILNCNSELGEWIYSLRSKSEGSVLNPSTVCFMTKVCTFLLWKFSNDFYH